MKKKVLFVSSFAGSSAYIYHLIYKPLPFSVIIVADKVGADYFKRRHIKVHYDLTAGSITAENILQKEKPDAVFTVSQYSACVEKYFMQNSKRFNSVSIDAIDHWSFYVERFSEVSLQRIVQKNIFLPDYIIVNDRIAKKAAIAAGLPRERLHMLGNPVLDDNLTVALKPVNFPLAKNRIIITFISEDLKKDFPRNSAFIRSFDEFSVLKDILSVIGQHHRITIKLHPAEAANKYKKFCNQQINVRKNMDILRIIKGSHFIIGMESMLLIELAKYRNDIISYRPGAKHKFVGSRIQATHEVRDKDELKLIINGKKKIKNYGFATRFSGSRQRIIEFIKERVL